MIEIEAVFDENQVERLMQIPELLRLKPAERIMKAMAQPVLARAKQYCPDGSESEKKQSKATRAKHKGRSKHHLGIKAVSHNKGARVYVGGKWPKANDLHFFGHKKGGRVRKLWGKDPNKLSSFRKIEKPHWLRKAYDETKAAQETAFVEQLKTELRELNLG